ncbi:MAG: OsmC family protein [Anaerolineaceae bacterium]|jgi:putative redox protein|nr:OsmC family protein [Anaerolineaceae bacterium]
MAANTTLRWIPDGKRFVSTDSTGHSVVLSTPDENMGMKPSELVLSALAGCASVDVVDILAKKRTPLSELEVQVTAEQDADPPWTFRKFHLHFKAKGEGLTEKNLEQAIALSEEKYCSVAATLRGKAEITTSYEIL